VEEAEAVVVVVVVVDAKFSKLLGLWIRMGWDMIPRVSLSAYD
jgi:hypothetical protein